MRTQITKAFTIIELLVVVSIIALLIGILLPAIGKARDTAYITRSQANVRQLGTAHAAYANEWNDNQWTLAPGGIGSYGNGPTLSDKVTGFLETFKQPPRSLPLNEDELASAVLGWANHNGVAKNWLYAHPTTHAAIVPIDLFPKSFQGDLHFFGSFQLINTRSFNNYVGGRFYDPTFFAPKDRAVLSAIAECYDDPGEYCVADGGPYFSSYVLSPAAMFSPDLFSKTFTIVDIYANPGTLRAPTYSQARYPDLKTHMLEHHWLQRARRECRTTQITAKSYMGCQPYFFNGARESMPVTLFYDGHVAMLSVREAVQADALALGQDGKGLWHRGTPHGKAGYWADATYAEALQTFGSTKTETAGTSSYHILTRHGILGRDTFSQ